MSEGRDFVEHPLIREKTIQKREYQENILSTSLEKNTLCVLPTGLGKTPIAAMLAAHRLQKYPESRVLVMAPTRPLTVQHHKTFKEFMNLSGEDLQHVTGLIKPEKRESLYKERKIIFATPQTVKNDLGKGRLTLKDFSLIVIDETHHAVGGYAYPYVVEKYIEEAENQRILGLTASPGGDAAKIADICRNAGIETVEIRTESDRDVVPYIKEKNIDFVYAELPESFIKIRTLIQTVFDARVGTLFKMGLVRRRTPSKKELLSLQRRLSAGIKQGYRKAFMGMFCTVQAIKLEHAITVLETQGISMLESYWKKLRSGTTKSDQSIAKNKAISNAMWLTQSLAETGASHPKISRLCSIVHNQLKENPDSRIIVFANYRDTVRDIVKALSGIENTKPVEFVGQREGLTQKEQSRIVREFSHGGYNTLVATSVAEEGIEIRQADIAIFYEPVPSGIRSIQRRGRVGRHSLGRVFVLITRGTRDEAYYWTSQSKEKQMKKTLYGMQKGL
jgi:Fanconi anemia group M protein